MVKQTIIINSIEEKEGKSGGTYFFLKTDKGNMSCFPDYEGLEDLKQAFLKGAEIEVNVETSEDGKFRNIRKEKKPSGEAWDKEGLLKKPMSEASKTAFDEANRNYEHDRKILHPEYPKPHPEDPRILHTPFSPVEHIEPRGVQKPRTQFNGDEGKAINTDVMCAKDIFVAMLNNNTPNNTGKPIGTSMTMQAAIQLVKQARKAF